LTEAIRREPAHPEAYIVRADAYEATNDTTRAAADRAQADRLLGRAALPSPPPQGAEAHAICRSETAPVDEAIRACTIVIQSAATEIERATGYDRRAYAYFTQYDFPGAGADMNEAIRLLPRQVDPRAVARFYSRRGAVFGAEGDVDREIADQTEAIQIDPGYPAAYGRRGFALLNRSWAIEERTGLNADELLNRAIADFTVAIQLDPKEMRAYLGRGTVFMVKKDPDRAIADFTESIRLDPNAAEPYEARAMAFGLKGDTERERADNDAANRLRGGRPR
jgi:tetratricopeptide (TPR) repeat protein